ncbi:MAG: LD-carboxypeptidase [Flavobacteriales bacterium]|jgi:muramoyltetrapeptide carboxypeptidase|nr:LD-carboxypeptidase [Flavobacteriales bacterium]
MPQPPYLKIGDKIAIVSTARKIIKEELSFAVNKLEEWGLEVVFGDHLFEENNQFAGNDSMRAADFQTVLDDDSVKAIICARGGYGTVRIVDGLDFSKFKKTPKWVVGYSDITVLHSHISGNLGIQTIHGTMPINFETNTELALESLRKTLFGERLTYEIPAHQFNRKGTREGELTGGNLSLLYSLMGSTSEINTAGKILFLEDVDEYLYHVDRMMQNLKRSGKLSNLAGLIVGAMSNMNDNAIPFGKTAEEIILEAVTEYNYPVCLRFPIGHIDDNRAIIVNKKANLVVGSSVKLIYEKQ